MDITTGTENGVEVVTITESGLYIQADTPKSNYYHIDGDFYWIPLKFVIHEDIEGDELILTRWIAEQKGLI